jgi:hypothetical protein
MPSASPATVSVVIPTHSEKRWSSLVRTVESARSQEHQPTEIVVVVDHNDALYKRATKELDGVTVLETNTPGARPEIATPAPFTHPRH